jgi:UDP-N-acetylmuramyl tripeptide synthase
LILLGQAGDRDEESIREMVRIAWQAGPAMLLLKELDLHLRGRELGEVPAIMEDELRQLGAPADRWSYASSELQAVQEALEWAQPGDLLLLLIHDSRDEVLAKLGAAAAETVKGSSD